MFQIKDFVRHFDIHASVTLQRYRRERENANSYNIVKPAAYDRNINQYDLLSCKQKLNK